jgi:hypothetical protein
VACEKFHKRYLSALKWSGRTRFHATPRRAVKAGRRDDSTQFQAGRYLGVGMTWALSTALFLYLGKTLDGRLGTRPWLTLIGAAVGGAAGFYYLYHSLTAAAVTQRSRAEDSEETK